MADLKTQKRMDEENVVCIYMMGFYLVTMKNEILSLAREWMHQKSIYLRETSQTKKNQCHQLLSYEEPRF